MALRLDRDLQLLVNDEAKVFDSQSRNWSVHAGTVGGSIVSPREAIRWVQRESGHPIRPPVAVLGTRTPTAEQSALAEHLGKLLADVGLTVLCGGRGGIMEDVCRGVAAAGGLSIGLLPDTEADMANPYVSVPLATGIGVARNALIARAACCAVAVGGGYGTLSEIAFALQFERPVFVLNNAPSVAGAVSYASAEEALDLVACALLREPPSRHP